MFALPIRLYSFGFDFISKYFKFNCLAILYGFKLHIKYSSLFTLQYFILLFANDIDREYSNN